MERKAFQLLHDAESSWWYQGRALVVRRVLKHFATRTPYRICDIGAGHGGMFSRLQMYGSVDAYEPDLDARSISASRGYTQVMGDQSLEQIPARTYSLIAAFDVLEHTPDDRAFLATLHRILTPEGSLIITIPAFSFLWSSHDVTHHHYRRYERRALIKLIEDSGFTVRYASYWNMLLFFPAALVRLLGRSGEGTLTMPRIIDRLFFTLVHLETVLIPHLCLPFGTGIVLYAKKNTPQT